MSNEALTWAWKKVRLGGNAGAKSVLAVLADHAGNYKGEDWTCFVGVATIADDAEMGERTVERHLAWLVANGWISRTRRPSRVRDDAVYDYVLHRARAYRTPAKLAGSHEREHGETPAKLAGDQSGDHPPISTQPPANSGMTTRQIGAAYIEEPLSNPLEPTPGAEAGVWVDLAKAYAELEAAYPQRMLGATDPDAAFTAFRRLVGEGVEPAELVGCARRMADDPTIKSRKIPIALETWLSKLQFRGWREETLAHAVRSADAVQGPAFDPPADVLAAIEDRKGSAWISSWLGQAIWVDDTRTIACRLGMQADRVRSDLGHGFLTEHRITIAVASPIERAKIDKSSK